MSKRILPDYFAFQKTRVDGETHVVGIDQPVDLDTLGDAGPIYLYTDTVTIDKDWNKLGQNFSINARKIIAKNNPTVRVSGPPPEHDYKPGDRPTAGSAGSDATSAGGKGGDGKAPATAASPGSQGLNAGNLIVSAQMLKVDPEGSKLHLAGDGGDGGRGQDGGHGGKGGKGGAGSDAQIQKGLQTDHIKKQGSPGGSGGSGGRGDNAGVSGNGGNGGSISISLLSGNDNCTTSYEPGGKGAATDIGKGGDKGTGAKGGKTASCHSHAVARSVVTVCEFDGKRAKLGSDGSKGPDGTKAADPIDGQAGNHVAYTDKAALNQIIATSSFYQRQLTLYRTREQYRNNSFDEAQEYLEWLEEIAPDFSDELAHPAGEALAASDGDVSPEEWTWLHKRVVTLSNQLQQGLDFPGYPSYALELQALPAVSQGIDALLNLTQKCEDAYNAYLAKVGDDSKQQAAFTDALSAYQDLLKLLQTQIQQDIESQQSATQTSMQTLEVAIGQQEAILQAFGSTFSDAVAAYVGCSMQDTLQALLSLVALDEWAQQQIQSIATMVGKLQPEGLTFDHAIQKVVIGGNTLDDLQKAWQQISSTVTSANPDAAKIVMGTSELESLVDGFFKAHTECGPNQQQAVQDLLGLLQAYNQRVLTWNALNIKGNFLKAEIGARQKELERVQAAFQKSKDCTGSPMRNLVMNLYFGTLDFCEEWLNREYRAYAYSKGVIKPFEIGSETAADLTTLHQTMQSEINRKNAQLSGSEKGTSFTDVPVELKAADYPEAFAQLQSAGSLVVTVPLGYPGFEGVARARVTEASIQVDGAESSSGKLEVTLHHTGQCLQEDPGGGTLTLNHNVVSTQGTVDLQSGQATLKLPVVMSQTLSPHTTWILEIPADANPGLQLGGVTSVRIGLTGVGIARDKIKSEM